MLTPKIDHKGCKSIQEIELEISSLEEKFQKSLAMCHYYWEIANKKEYKDTTKSILKQYNTVCGLEINYGRHKSCTNKDSLVDIQTLDDTREFLYAVIKNTNKLVDIYTELMNNNTHEIQLELSNQGQLLQEIFSLKRQLGFIKAMKDKHLYE